MMRRNWMVYCGIALLLMVAPAISVQAQVFVDRFAIDGGDGTDWDTAHNTIQEAIDDPRSATEPIWVARGGYPEQVVMASGRQIYGGFEPGANSMAGRDLTTFATVIQRDEATTYSRPVRYDGTANTLLDGFTVRFGNPDPADLGGHGGGILMQNCANGNVLRNLSILDNEAINGGGIYMLNCDDTTRVEDCFFTRNTATDGGAIACTNASPIIRSSFFAEHSVLDDGGTIYLTSNASPLLDDLEIQYSSAMDLGGAIYASVNSSPAIVDSQIFNCEARSGGAIYFREGSAGTISHCSIFRNTATENGGGIAASQNSPFSLIDSIVIKNFAGESGGGIHAEGSGIQLIDSEISLNTATLRGAGFMSEQSSGVNIAQSAIHSNTTPGDGGGVYMSGGSLALNSVSIVRNTGDTSGAAIYNDGAGSLTMTNCQVFQHSSTNYHTHLTSSSTTVIQSCTFERNDGSLGLLQQATAQITNTILANTTGFGIFEENTDADAVVNNCLFHLNGSGAFRDEGLQTFASAEAINTFVADSSGNVDQAPAFVYEGSSSMAIQTGTVIISGMQSVVQTVVTSPELEPGELAGKFISPDNFTFSGYYIIDNGATTMTLRADTFSGGTLFVRDYRLTIDSGAIDAGSPNGAPPIDFAGAPRPVDAPDLGATGELAFDIGAFELQEGMFSNAVYVVSPITIRKSIPLEPTGLSWDRAYRSIQQAIDDPRSATLPIYVSRGDYDERINLASGRRIYGSMEIGDTEPNYDEPGLDKGILNVFATSRIFDNRNGDATPDHLVRAVDLSDVYMTFFALQGGSADAESGEFSNGGGLYLENAQESVVFELIRISGCSALGQGGAIYINGGAPQLRAFQVYSNSSGEDGGAIALTGGTTALLDAFQINSAFTGNRGGGVFVSASSPVLRNLYLSDNYAVLGGGVAYDSGSGGLLENCTIRNCSATAGGGVFIRNSAPSISTTLFNFNSASQLGGGMVIDSSGASVAACFYIDNASAGDGGAILIRNAASPFIHDTYLHRNNADGNGGGIAVLGSSSPVVTACEIHANRSFGIASLGGGIYARNSTIALADSALIGNTSEGGGGVGLFNTNGLMDRNQFVENSAGGQGGGAIHFSDSPVVVANSNFVLNRSAAQGGALQLQLGGAMVVNCSFALNRQDLSGPSIVFDAANPTLINNLFNERLAQPVIAGTSLLGEIALLEHNLFQPTDAYLQLPGGDPLTTESELNAINGASGNIVGEARVLLDFEGGVLNGTFESAVTEPLVPSSFGNSESPDANKGGAFITGATHTFVTDDQAAFGPGQLTGTVFRMGDDEFRRIRSNTETTVEVWGGLQLSEEDFYWLDLTPINNSAALDAATTTTLAMLDLYGTPRPVDLPFATNPAPATTLDIGAIELTRSRSGDLLLRYLLGQILMRPGDPILDSFDANQDGSIDAADLVTTLP